MVAQSAALSPHGSEDGGDGMGIASGRHGISPQGGLDVWLIVSPRCHRRPHAWGPAQLRGQSLSPGLQSEKWGLQGGW